MSAIYLRGQAVPRDVADAIAERAGRLRGFAARLVYFETVGSTNDVAERLAADGADHGTVVVAEAQEQGRGRMGRDWFSPPGAGLYVSVVLRPEPLVDAGHAVASFDPGSVMAAASLTLTAGVALAEALRFATGLAVDLKWPNDVVVDRRKLCGILAEASVSSGRLQHVVVGYGINLRPAAYPPDLGGRATSLEAELGRPVDAGQVLAESLACLAERLRELPAGGFPRILERWTQLSPSSRGAAVEVLEAGAWIPARTHGVDADGALLVQTAAGARRVIAGEVRWL
ncbi:MAG: biotin--[acetyl-CoA-carboxylase] ligase [Acidobacteria bacterium]|nr:MAG: biotin--[acetyl-CoA-carboxylase] ligase [Acidobacteriota bacterium]